MKYATNFGEFRVQTLRDTPVATTILDNPATVGDYIRNNILTSPQFDPDVENFWVIYLNARRRPIGFAIVTRGTLDQTLVHAREIFRPAIVANSHSIIIGHNHPSGDATPSEPDIRLTRELIRAGALLKINVLDHIIIGERNISMRELGYFYL
jgi:DNA repair protein RadC